MLVNYLPKSTLFHIKVIKLALGVQGHKEHVALKSGLSRHQLDFVVIKTHLSPDPLLCNNVTTPTVIKINARKL